MLTEAEGFRSKVQPWHHSRERRRAVPRPRTMSPPTIVNYGVIACYGDGKTDGTISKKVSSYSIQFG